MSDNIFHIYYEINKNLFNVYNPRYKRFSTMTLLELNQLSKKYEMFKGYDADENGLVEYYLDFRKWNDELRNENLVQFTFSYKNKYAVLNAFERYSKQKLKSYKEMHIIDAIESFWFEDCNNGGLIYCKEGTYDCHGYDFNSFYPRIMGESKYDLKIPVRKGKQIFLHELDKDELEFGFYYVKIECKVDDFNKIFNYSKKNIYTSYSLEFAFKHQEKFGVEITLLDDKEFNAYIYDMDDLVYARELFGNWFNTLSDFKTKYPKNKLAKHLLSSLWGTLSGYKKQHVNKTDIENYDWGTDEECEYILQTCSNDNNNDYYTLIQRENRYIYNIRLKPFLLSYARNVIGDIAHDNHLSEVVRIMTDNITYKSNVDFKVPNMIAEDKTTGHIYFKNVMRYEQRKPKVVKF